MRSAARKSGMLRGEIGRDDPHQGDAGIVMAFGDHLGPDQDVHLAARQTVQDAAMGSTGPSRVSIHALHGRFGEKPLYRLLDALRPRPRAVQADPCAAWTRFWSRGSMAAVVTAEAGGLKVEGERDGAVGTLGHVATVPAKKGGGEPTAVEEEKALFLPFQAFLKGFLEGFREDALRRCLPSHVHDGDRGEGALLHSFGHGEVVILSLSPVPVTFEGRGGRAQDHRRPRKPPPDEGHVTGMVTGTFFLLIGGLVLLVDDDESQSGHRGEDGRAGAHDDGDLPGGRTPPSPVALRVAEVAVEFNDLLAEALPKPSEELRCEGNLGDEDNGPFPVCQDLLDGAKVELGLSAGGHPVEQEGLKPSLAERLRDRPKGLRLMGRGTKRRRFWPVLGLIACTGCLLDSHPAFG